MNEALKKFYDEIGTKEVSSPTGITYRIKAQSGADYMAALGCVPSFRKRSKDEPKQEERPIEELLALQVDVCQRCTLSMKFGDVDWCEPGDPADWPAVDVALVYSTVCDMFAPPKDDDSTERRIL